jgi:hypothetical protein
VIAVHFHGLDNQLAGFTIDKVLYYLPTQKGLKIVFGADCSVTVSEKTEIREFLDAWFAYVNPPVDNAMNKNAFAWIESLRKLKGEATHEQVFNAAFDVHYRVRGFHCQNHASLSTWLRFKGFYFKSEFGPPPTTFAGYADALSYCRKECFYA